MSDDLEGLANNTVSRANISEAELKSQVVALGSRWTIVGPDLVLTLAGQKGMKKCGEAVGFATQLADEMDHHPHIVMDYPQTTLAIHTHDKQAITLLDLVWAARLERWLRDHGWGQ
ncbi:MAG: 4a-hydroxytetrahydrobiopterin dehydratase [Kofleriaceae bacterium]